MTMSGEDQSSIGNRVVTIEQICGVETSGCVEKRKWEEIGNPKGVTIVRNSADA